MQSATESRQSLTHPALFARIAPLFFRCLMLAGGVLGFLVIADMLRRQQDTIVSSATMTSHLDDAGRLRPLSDVVALTQTLKLVTVVVDARVQAVVRDDSWRGSAAATVEAPVQYIYGIDLSKLQSECFSLDNNRGCYGITLPPPARIAVDVDGSHPISETVDVGGTRFRTRAGEYCLGLARKKVYDQARQNTLSQEQMQDIRQKTRTQVEDLVRRFVGPNATVKVRFGDQYE